MLPQIVAGDTLTHTVTLRDYPASAGWVLSYRLIPASGSAITFNASASGDDHVVSVAAATTSAWAVGKYAAKAYATLALVRYSVPSESGQITIAPNPASVAVGTELRSTARIALDNIEATIEGRATSAVLEYEINGRQLRYLSPADLMALQKYFAGKVALEDAVAAGSQAHKGKVYVRLARA
jgi:hypothetical protein